MEQQTLRIGEWELHCQLNELTGPTETIRLEPRTSAVLSTLARRPGEVCSRREILAAVWGDAFVGEAVLTHSIWELRRAFGDDAKNPRFIQTVPRLGYRLLPRAEPKITERSISSAFRPGTMVKNAPPLAKVRVKDGYEGFANSLRCTVTASSHCRHFHPSRTLRRARPQRVRPCL